MSKSEHCFRDAVNGLVYRALVLPEGLSCRLTDCVIATNGSYKAVEMERGRVPTMRRRPAVLSHDLRRESERGS